MEDEEQEEKNEETAKYCRSENKDEHERETCGEGQRLSPVDVCLH